MKFVWIQNKKRTTREKKQVGCVLLCRSLVVKNTHTHTYVQIHIYIYTNIKLYKTCRSHLLYVRHWSRHVSHGVTNQHTHTHTHTCEMLYIIYLISLFSLFFPFGFSLMGLLLHKCCKKLILIQLWHLWVKFKTTTAILCWSFTSAALYKH